MKISPSRIYLQVFLALLFFSIFIINGKAQSKKIDSLFKVLKTQKEDTGRVNTLNNLSWALCVKSAYTKSDSLAQLALQLAQRFNYKRGIALAYQVIGNDEEGFANYNGARDAFNKAFVLFKETGDTSGMGNASGNIGSSYRMQGDYVNALKYQMQALKFDLPMGNYKRICKDYGNIGNIYYGESNYPEALKYYLKGLEMAEKSQDKYTIGVSRSSIGNINLALNNLDTALVDFKKALAMFIEVGDKYDAAISYTCIASAYSKMGKLDESIQNTESSLKINESIGNKHGLGINYTNLGLDYEQQGDYKQALENLQRGLEIKRKTGDKHTIAYSFHYMGEIYRKLKNYALAKSYLDSAIRLSKLMLSKDIIADAYTELAKLDSSQNNYKSAFEDYKNYIIYRDSLSNEENTKKLVSEQMQYEFDKKQAEEKAEQDKKDAIASQESKKQLIIRNSFIAGFVLVLALAFFIFRGYKQKQKANEIIVKQKQEVEQQKSIVEEKQKEILDSIHYAQRIQKALLASDTLLNQNLPDYFVLYKPKDIVSGDFYWATQKDDKFYLAVCDSTGHGVPGAFMSLLNTSFLNEAINEKNITNPNEVFNHARKRLIENISQDGQQDGMDGIIASLSLSKGGSLLNYAAAYNAPIVMRNSEIIELNADKMPVGSSPKQNEPFALHSVELKKGDCLYLFTDGFADQFGGDKGKKLKYKQLLQLIKNTAPLSMREQKQVLEKAFEDWKGSLEQVDDVLVVGIRV